MEILNKTINLIVSSEDYREFIKKKRMYEIRRKRDLERVGRNISGVRHWKMDGKWGKKVDKFLTHGTQLERNNETNKRYRIRKGLTKKSGLKGVT